MAEAEQRDLTMLTVELLSAYVAKNEVKSDDLAGLIKSTHEALAAINAPAAPEPVAQDYPPAVTVRKSLASRDHLISMIDGKPYKTLKRHASRHGLTPAEYRERYKLPADYPMVAPAYSEHRRNVAQHLGLGRKAAVSTDAEPAVETSAEAPQEDVVDGSAAVAVEDPVAADSPPAAADTPVTAPDRKKPATAKKRVAKSEPAAKAPGKAKRGASQRSPEEPAAEKPQKARRTRKASPDAETESVDGPAPTADEIESEAPPIARRGRRGVKFATTE